MALLIAPCAYSQPPKELAPIIEVAGADSGSGLGYLVKGIGDLNKDGFADVAVAAPYLYKTFVYYGGRPMSNKPALTFEGGGTVVSGDFNHDGWLDLAIEKWFEDTVFVYLGGPLMDTVPDLVLHAEHSGDLFGSTLASGDFKGDGSEELVIGAQYYASLDSSSQHFRGKLYIYNWKNGLDSIPALTLLGDSTNYDLGYDLGVGDIDHNGKKDLIALGLNRNVTGVGVPPDFYLTVYGGDSSLLLNKVFTIDSRNVTGGFKDKLISFDADSDGIDDILVNRIYIFKGGASIDTIPSYYIPPPNDDTLHFGTYPWVAGGGDYNGDGIKDILLSATQGYPGGVYGFVVMLGKRGSPGHYAAYRFFSQCCGDHLTGRPENAGDVNGDGIDDIIIGAPDAPFPKSYGFFGIYSGDTSLVVAVNEGSSALPTQYHLQQNYPNPFNPQTTIEYSLPSREFVSVKIYDVLGDEITSLVNREQTAGHYIITWDGSNAKGNKIGSGVYYYQLHTENFTGTMKMIYLK